MGIDQPDTMIHIEGMTDKKPAVKGKKRATVIIGVQMREPYFVPGIGTIEAESLEEAIKKSKKGKVEDGNK